MPRTRDQLQAIALEKLPPGLHCDGLNLYLQVTPTGNRSWLFRYYRDGRSRAMGLGPLHTISLKEARRRAAKQRLLLTDGGDPFKAREQSARDARLAEARSITFRDCAERYIAGHQASWRSSKHLGQWKSSLETYVYPALGALPVSAIDTTLTMQVLEPIWQTKTETAVRVRGRIELVLDWAAAREYRPKGENPARWRGHLDKLLPAKSKIARVQHHKALPYAEVPAFMADLDCREGMSARALEWTILTAARSGEALKARWDEIDADGRVWCVPADRMKAKREHRVPLSDRALAVLARLPRIERCAFLFPGTHPGSSLSHTSMSDLLADMQPGTTVHGFRSSFRDWAAEQTNHPRDIAEAALAHTNRDKTEAAYRRGDALEKRRALMVDWASYCGGINALPR